MNATLFHLAFPVNDLAAARDFYIDGLGFIAGRQSSAALIMNIAGNQVVAQLDKAFQERQDGIYPRHFGLIFTARTDWQALLDRAHANRLPFYREPSTRFIGKVVEHDTFFLRDPSGNLLEFKFYRHPSAVFGETEFSAVGDEDRG